LFADLGAFLRARQCGVVELECRLTHRHVPTTRCVVRLAAPATDVHRLAGLLGERLSALDLPEPARACELRADALVPYLPGSNALWQPGEHGGSAGNEACGLIERLCARLGSEAVHGLTGLPAHRPENAWAPTEPPPAAGLRSFRRGGAAAIRGAALPVQLHLPARRLASARAGGAGGLTRLRRARDHRRVLGRRRGAGAHGGAGSAPEAHHRLGVSPGLRAQAGRARHRPARLRTAVPPHHPRPARGRTPTVSAICASARVSHGCIRASCSRRRWSLRCSAASRSMSCAMSIPASSCRRGRPRLLTCAGSRTRVRAGAGRAACRRASAPPSSTSSRSLPSCATSLTSSPFRTSSPTRAVRGFCVRAVARRLI